MDSILTSVKKIIGISEEDESFDVDLIMHINSIILVLDQLGLESASRFTITDKNATWNDLFSDGEVIEPVKSYIALRVRMIFDPPNSSAVAEAIKNTIAELEWRITAITDYNYYGVGGENK